MHVGPRTGILAFMRMAAILGALLVSASSVAMAQTAAPNPSGLPGLLRVGLPVGHERRAPFFLGVGTGRSAAFECLHHAFGDTKRDVAGKPKAFLGEHHFIFSERRTVGSGGSRFVGASVGDFRFQ